MNPILLALFLQSSIALTGPVRPDVYMEASGRRAAFLGREDGRFEAWVYPMKVLRDFELLFELEDYAAPIPARGLATEVSVAPEASRVRYANASFTVDATWLVPLEEGGGVVLLDVDASDPLTVLVRFQPEMKLMWPAGLGGQYSYWDDALDAYVITESTREHAALVGSPFAARPPGSPAHNLPDAPTEFRIPVPEGGGVVPIAIAASVEGLDAARGAYARLLGEHERLLRESAAHYEHLREETSSIDTPDDALDLALEWGKVALDKGFVCNPQLGCGLVAGLGPSGRSERPGFDWYFGGDAFFNMWAMTAYGDFETVRASLRFLRDRQRDDGKMMHELSQSAAYIQWFEEFPYGYYHADTTPLYIVAASDYIRASGDADFAREIWPSLLKAYEYGLSADENDDGLMDNTLAGLGAVETGSLRSDAVLTDVYLASVWTEAKYAIRELALTLGEEVPASLPDRLQESFVHEDGIAFAMLTSGAVQREDTVWPGFGLWRHRLASEKGLDAIASSRLASDWGARMLSRESALYDHKSYNNGGVWPFLTGYASLALYANGRPEAGWAYVEGTKELTFLGARGYVPEILSGDRLVPGDASVPHQLFSTSGLVSPLLRGLIGYGPESGRLEPRPPASWDRFRVENLRRGESRFDFEWQRIRGSREDRVRVKLSGDIEDLEVVIDGKIWRPENGAGTREHETRVRAKVELTPIWPPLRQGDRSSRLRILQTRQDGNTFVARLEGRSGTRYQMRARFPSPPESIEGAERKGDVLELTFPEAPTPWTTRDLTIKLPR